MRLGFKRLRKSELLLFDTYRSDILISEIIKSTSYLGLQTRVCDRILWLHIDFKVIIYAIKFIVQKSKLYFPSSLPKRIALSYYSAVISISNTREVLTLYGSNSVYFPHLTKIHSDVIFKAYIPHQIHNRHLLLISTAKNCIYHVMGDFDKEQLVLLGVHDRNVKTIGSLYSIGFQKSIAEVKYSMKYDIMVISQYQHFWEEEDCSDIRIVAKQIFDKMMEYLATFLIENKTIKVVIAFRPQPSIEAEKSERKYFESYFNKNSNVFYRINEGGKFSSYDLLMKSKVILTHYSTLAFEAFAFKKKVLFCQFYDYSSKFSIPDDIKYVCREPRYDFFNDKLKFLLDSNEMNSYLESMKKRYNNI